MNASTTHHTANANDALFLAPETHQRAATQSGFKVEVSTSDPTTRDPKRDSPVSSLVTPSRSEARRSTRSLLRQGYWVEVFDAASKGLLAGPFDPDQGMPRFVV